MLVKDLQAAKFVKSHPQISERLTFGCTVFSNVELDTGMIQKTIPLHLQPVAVQVTDASECINYLQPAPPGPGAGTEGGEGGTTAPPLLFLRP